MSAPTTVRPATRRLVGLTALRWLPVGLTAPVMVLLAQARELSLARSGCCSPCTHGRRRPRAAHRRPRRALGRRPVTVAGTALHLLSCVAFALATDFAGFLAAVLLLALGRSLDSGPLEAWYFDTVHRLEPDADVAPGLSLHSAADGGGLAVGAVVGGLLPGLLGGGAAVALALPFLAAAVLDLLYVAAVLRPCTRTGRRARAAAAELCSPAPAPCPRRWALRSHSPYETGRCGSSCCSPPSAASAWSRASCWDRAGSPTSPTAPTAAPQ